MNNRFEWKHNGEFCTLSFGEAGFVHLTFGGAGIAPVVKEPLALLPITAAETAHGTLLHAGCFSAEINGDRLVLLEHGRVFFEITSMTRAEDLHELHFREKRSAKIYGLGQEPNAKIDHNGQERRMWNQWGGHERSGNLGIGFFTSTDGHGVLLNSTADARFCFNESTSQRLDWLGEAMVPSLWQECPQLEPDTGCIQVRGSMDLVIFPGEVTEVLRKYYCLTGMPGMLPKWAYGFLQCRNRYKNQAELEYVARQLRQRGIPCDCLVIDWLWFREFGDLEWRSDDWPNPEEMLTKLHDMGFHVMSAQHPFISEKGKYYHNYVTAGYLNSVPETKRITWDHSNPEARKHWWSKTKKLAQQGIDGYWTDMGELEEHFEGTHSYAGGRNETHNAYSANWAKGLYEGQRGDFGSRMLMLSRSGCAGIQKYGTAVWSGDINAAWQVLRDQVRLGQTMSLSGIPWWCTDIGGFLTGKEFAPELYIRWMEWGVFCGLFRTHGTRPGNEPWSFGVQSEPIIRQLIALRYRLLPYIYSEAMKCAVEGTPMVQPISVVYPDDLAASDESEYLFGSSLLVAPVTEPGVRFRRVILPKGTWYHFWSGKKYEAGEHLIPAPLGQIPIFLKKGTLVPAYECIGRNAAECGSLELLHGAGDRGEYVLYDDCGEGYGYEQGDYSAIRFTAIDFAAKAEVLKGTAPQTKSVTLTPKTAEITADIQPEGRNARLRIAFAKAGTCQIEIAPENGWVVTGMPDTQLTDELYENQYYPVWKEEAQTEYGTVLTYALADYRVLRSAGPYSVKLIITNAEGLKTEQILQWGNASLDNPEILGCLPVGAREQGINPACDGAKYRYSLNGRDYVWLRDTEFGANCFGYVDFRRFAPQRQGEAMLGEAWARYRLFCDNPRQTTAAIRYDSPAEVWLNGTMVFKGTEACCPRAEFSINLPAGESALMVFQQCSVERPYSGGEFGFSLEIPKEDGILFS